MDKTKPIHAFMAGTHTTRLGHSVTISESDLQASAAAYNPELHEAPLVIGHPEGTAPAYGWIESCQVSGKDFFVSPKQVNPEFAEMHNAGAFKKRSMSFYHPDNKENPVPGTWYPRHLGFLGAQPPAIKGLSDYAFEESGGDVLTVDFGEWTDRVEAGMWRSLREWILDKFGKEAADAAVPGWDVDLLHEEAVKPELDKPGQLEPAFSEAQKDRTDVWTAEGSPKGEGHGRPESQNQRTEGHMTPEEIAAKQAELDAQDAAAKAKAADFAEREKKLAERERTSHRGECADFVESLVGEGKVLPAHKDNLIEFMAGLEHIETVDFAEGDATVKKSPLQFMQDYLKDQPKAIEFGEHNMSNAADAVDVTDPVVLAHAAADFVEAESAKGRTVTITDAVNHIKKTQGGSAQ